jgi:hypothetical protein
MIMKAAQWCRDNAGKGAKAAKKTGLFPGVTHNEIHNELKRGNRVIIRDHHHQILTNDERLKLADWLIGCADGDERGVQQRKDDAAAARLRTQQQQDEVFAAFARRETACQCGEEPCPYAKWVRCPQCGPKASKCRVRACVTLRKEPAADPDAQADPEDESAEAVDV